MEEKDNPTQCKNCNATFHGHYCPDCGQKGSVQRITFGDTLTDFADMVFSVDAPFVRTLKSLFLQPGEMMRAFLSGKRKRYYKPVAFFVLMTILYLLIRSIIGYDPLLEAAVRVDGDAKDLVVKAQRLMFENITKFLFFFVFWFGLLLKIFFFRKYTLAEYWTVAFYLVGGYIILSTLSMFLVQYVSSDLQFVTILLIGIYFVYALCSLFKTPKWLIILKAIFIYFLSVSLYIVSAFILSYFIVFISNQ